MPRNWSKLYPLHLVSNHLFLVLSEGKRDTGSSRLHSFHFAAEQRGREGNLSPKSSVLLSPLFLTVFLFLLPPGWSGQACGFGHRKLWILRRMEDVLWGDILASTHPLTTPKWHLTPSCVYIRAWKWEIVMSHSGCVFTLRSHARKEISHGLLKVARWERIAAVPQRCSDLPLRGWIYFTSSLLRRLQSNRKRRH